MFIYINRRDNEQFMINTNCPVVGIVQYIKNRLGRFESELLDLYDKNGELKFLFLPENMSQESALKLLNPRESYNVCIINRLPDGAYTSVTSLSDVDSSLLETMQAEIEKLEKTRLQQLYIAETRMVTSEKINAQALPTKTTKKRKKVM